MAENIEQAKDYIRWGLHDKRIQVKQYYLRKAGRELGMSEKELGTDRGSDPLTAKSDCSA
jgi:hypothetical protein